MAPTAPGTLVVDTLSPDTLPEKFERRKPRRIGPLTQKGLPRKKPGPTPKPLAERLKARALKEIKRVERSYTRERRIQVLLWLINHRVPDERTTHLPRRRRGQPLVLERSETDPYIWYRTPTYEEASAFWKVPVPTIQGWWDRRKKILEGTGIEVPEEGPTNVQSQPQADDGDSQGEGGPAPSGSEPSPNQSQTVDTPASIQTPTLRAMNDPLPLTTRVRVVGSASPPRNRTAPRIQRVPRPVRFDPPKTGSRPLLPAPPVQPAKPAQPVQPASQIPPVPPAYNPANYVVVYIGPPGTGPPPGQHCIHPGAILPVVYSGQPMEVPPISYAAVWPSDPPAPAMHPPAPVPAPAPAPAPPPGHSGSAVHPGPHKLSHGPQGPQGPPQGPPESPVPSRPPAIAPGPSHRGQPGVPPGQQSPPNPQGAPTTGGVRPLAPRPDPPPRLQWRPIQIPAPGTHGGPAPPPPHAPYVGPPGYISPYNNPPQSYAAAQMPHSHARPHPPSATVHTGPPPTPGAQAPRTSATSGPLPTAPANAAPPQGQHPVTPPGQQHPAQPQSLPAPPSSVRAQHQVPPTNAAEPQTARAVDTTKSQQKEGERTDTNTPKSRCSPSSTAVDQSQSRDADANASTAVSPVSSPMAIASAPQNESAATPLATTATPNEETAVTSPAATASPGEAHLPMEVDNDAEESAERLSTEGTLPEKTAPMEIDTETAPETVCETPMEVDTEMVSEARAAIAAATKGSPDSLFGSAAPTPAP